MDYVLDYVPHMWLPLAERYVERYWFRLFAWSVFCRKGSVYVPSEDSPVAVRGALDVWPFK